MAKAHPISDKAARILARDHLRLRSLPHNKGRQDAEPLDLFPGGYVCKTGASGIDAGTTTAPGKALNVPIYVLDENEEYADSGEVLPEVRNIAGSVAGDTMISVVWRWGIGWMVDVENCGS